MKSIKPGRGPSMMGGIGSVVMVVFGIFWTITAASMGAPILFPVFGVLFICMGAAQAIYNFKNATGKNRYSSFDIVEEHEETDPLQQRLGNPPQQPQPRAAAMSAEDGFCPYCGNPVAGEFDFCPKCGRQLPRK